MTPHHLLPQETTRFFLVKKRAVKRQPVFFLVKKKAVQRQPVCFGKKNGLYGWGRTTRFFFTKKTGCSPIFKHQTLVSQKFVAQHCGGFVRALAFVCLQTALPLPPHERYECLDGLNSDSHSKRKTFAPQQRPPSIQRKVKKAIQTNVACLVSS